MKVERQRRWKAGPRENAGRGGAGDGSGVADPGAWAGKAGWPSSPRSDAGQAQGRGKRCSLKAKPVREGLFAGGEGLEVALDPAQAFSDLVLAGGVGEAQVALGVRPEVYPRSNPHLGLVQDIEGQA